MPIKLLVSVRNEVEARQALTGGCDILDIKEPALGSLGAATPEETAGIVAAVGGTTPVSAALGELIDLGDSSLTQQIHGGLTYLKAGSARLATLPDWKERWHKFAAQTHHRTVAVIYADGQSVAAPPHEELFEEAKKSGAAGLLIDTCLKGSGHLLDWMSIAELQEWRRQTTDAGMFLALAGSVRLEMLPELQTVKPDIIAVRGAVCRGGDRTATIDEKLVRLWSDRLNPGRSRLPADLVAR